MIRLQINKRQMIILSALIFVFAVFSATLYLTRPEPVQNDEGSENTEIAESISESNVEAEESIENTPAEIDPLISDMLAQLESQAQVDNMLLAELNSGEYSFEDPLVMVNPYGVSPLTALVLFTSDGPVNISVHIPGKTKLADVDFTFDGYNTSHQIPIYGLYPNELNKVSLTATAQDGISKSVVLEMQTDPLPPELKKNIFITDLVQPENYQPGFNYTFAPKSAFDVNGEYRWFYNYPNLNAPSEYSYNGNMVFVRGANYAGDVLLFEVNTFGKIMNVCYSPFGAHHDVAAIDGKNLIVNGSYENTVEDFLYEIDVESGQIANTLDLKYILQRTRDTSPLYSTTDWFHHNATVYDNGSIVISGRHQSAVVKMSWPEGKIDWILSNHTGWNPMFDKYLLSPAGNDFEWQYAQHGSTILPDLDNDPDTIDILLFDNGVDRVFAGVPPYSRIVHYRINEKERTVEQIWQFGKELGETYYCFRCSGANSLQNGNILGTFDKDTKANEYAGNTNFVEIDSLGKIVWEVYATSTDETGRFNSYRLERLPLYTSAANDLCIGIPAKNFIPEDKLK